MGSRGMVQRAGERDSVKGSSTRWDQVAGAPALMLSIRHVPRGASERRPEEEPQGCCWDVQDSVFLSLGVAVPLGWSDPLGASGHLLLGPWLLVLQNHGKAPAARRFAPLLI